MRECATKFAHFLFIALSTMFSIAGCSSHSVPGSPGVPEPIKVLENPTTGERVRLFKEIPYKVPKDYDEKKHVAEWMTEHQKRGFTKEIKPEDDRKQLTELRRKNLEAGQRHPAD